MNFIYNIFSDKLFNQMIHPNLKKYLANRSIKSNYFKTNDLQNLCFSKSVFNQHFIIVSRCSIISFRSYFLFLSSNPFQYFFSKLFFLVFSIIFPN